MQQFYDIYYAPVKDAKTLSENINMDRVNEYNVIIYQRIKFVQNSMQVFVFGRILQTVYFVLISIRAYREGGMFWFHVSFFFSHFSVSIHKQTIRR